MSTREQDASSPTADELVSDADYVQLSRLVIEHAWRVDNGRAATVHELYAEDGELDIGSPTPPAGTPGHRGVGPADR